MNVLIIVCTVGRNPLPFYLFFYKVYKQPLVYYYLVDYYLVDYYLVHYH